MADEIPRAEIFKRLRELWIQRRDSTSTSLATLLGVPRQKVNDYASGDRPTPDWVLQRMAQELNVQIVVRGNGFYVVSSTRETQAKAPQGAAGPVIPWGSGT